MIAENIDPILIVLANLLAGAFLAYSIVSYQRVLRQIQGLVRKAGKVAVSAWVHIRRVIVFVIGATVVLLGVVMIFTPGPAVVFIPAGFAILGIEFAWARRLLRRMKEKIQIKAEQRESGQTDG